MSAPDKQLRKALLTCVRANCSQAVGSMRIAVRQAEEIPLPQTVISLMRSMLERLENGNTEVRDACAEQEEAA